MFASAYPESHAVSVINTDHPAAEVRFERVQNLHVTLVLDNGEFRKNLHPRAHVAVGADSHVKASFAIHKAYDPLGIELHLEHS
jgi:hypothetical protein